MKTCTHTWTGGQHGRHVCKLKPRHDGTCLCKCGASHNRPGY